VAGSGIRGQFEEKFKALLRDIEDQVILTTIGHVGPTTDVFHREAKLSVSLTKFVRDKSLPYPK
jgi:hypothetical protein